MPPLLLGLTGNIGCGKSTVGRLLAERYGADYVDADALVHQLYGRETPETRAIVARFGTHPRRPDGTLDRRRLGDLVLGDPAALADLERILRPGVLRLIRERLASSTAPVVVLDAIKLIESGLARECHAVWVVTCDRDSQLQRLTATRGFTEAQAVLRVEAQPPQAEKLPHATQVIENRGTLADLEQRVAAAWQALRRERRQAGRVRRGAAYSPLGGRDSPGASGSSSRARDAS